MSRRPGLGGIEMRVARLAATALITLLPMSRRLSLYGRLSDQLFRQVDASSLVFMRVLFGVIMLVEVWRFWTHGWIARYYIDPDFTFKYYGFEWLEPWPGSGMYWHFVLLAALAFLIGIGALYRFAAVLFLFAFSYVFLLDQARYLNHLYLVILLALLMMVVPANRYLAVDSMLRPKPKSSSVPAWSVWLFRLQFEVVYLYAGLVKLNPDWLRLEPMGMWLAGQDHWPVIGPLFNEVWVVALASYGVVGLHLVGAPLLLMRRTRPYVMVLYFAFHLMNHFLFRIGIFPWIAMAGTLMFLEPDWPRRTLRWIRNLPARCSRLVGWRPLVEQDNGAPESPLQTIVLSHFRKRVLFASLSVWLGLQVLVPLRHLLYPGNPSWTEEGHRFAWQMKLRDKQAQAVFFVRDPMSGQEWSVAPRAYLMPHQVRTMAVMPDMALQFAHYLAHLWAEERDVRGVEVYARICASLNGRAGALLINPQTNLARVERNLRHADWILPLEQPLQRPPRKTGRRGPTC